MRKLWLLVPIPVVVACAASSVPGGSAPSATEPSARPAPSSPVPAASAPPDEGPVDASAPPADTGAPPEPVVFVHGINGDSGDFKVMIDRLILDGWPQDRLSAIDYPDPSWGCNVDNAEILRQHVAKFLQQTGAAKIDLVAHSMGTLSSRKFIRDLGGAALVHTYVTLGGPHHGVPTACLDPLPICVHNELCADKPFLTGLNTPPVTPGPTIWVSIFSHDDHTVPWQSSELDGAENIAFDGVDHDGENGLTERADVYAQVKHVLQYP
jgi:triacylglycerol lipase